MDIDIHPAGIHLQKQHRHRVTAAHQRIVVTLQQGRIEAAALHGARVHEEDLLRTRGPIDAGPPEITMNPHAAVLGIDFQEGLLPIAAKNRRHSFFQRRPGGVLPEHRPVPSQHPAHLRPREGRQAHPVLNVTPLRLLRPQKLSPAGNVGKKLAHLDAGSRRTARPAGPHHFTPIDDDFRALHGIRLPRLQGETADGSDAGQGLAAETKGLDFHQVPRIPDLAGGMPLQRQQGVLRPHPTPVVEDPDQGTSTPLHRDFDFFRTGIQGIFHQLLDHRGRPFHHLSGGYPIRHHFRQQADLLAHRSPRAPRCAVKRSSSVAEV